MLPPNAPSHNVQAPSLAAGPALAPHDTLTPIYAPAPRYRPYPLKVVFGEPIEPREGDTPGGIHARYCAALMRLAKQHDVPLQIVE